MVTRRYLEGSRIIRLVRRYLRHNFVTRSIVIRSLKFAWSTVVGFAREFQGSPLRITGIILGVAVATNLLFCYFLGMPVSSNGLCARVLFIFLALVAWKNRGDFETTMENSFLIGKLKQLLRDPR